jgi:hypothetical protein
MGTKIDHELSRHLQEAEHAEPQRQIPVIITLNEGADVAELERRGLKALGRVESIRAIYGTIAASAVSQVEGLDSVARIEYDGRAWALDGSRP